MVLPLINLYYIHNLIYLPIQHFNKIGQKKETYLALHLLRSYKPNNIPTEISTVYSPNTRYSRLSGCGEGEEMPLAGGQRAGPAQCSPARRLDASSCDVSSLSSGEEDERLRRYRTASAPSHLSVQPATLPQVTQLASYHK